MDKKLKRYTPLFEEESYLSEIGFDDFSGVKECKDYKKLDTLVKKRDGLVDEISGQDVETFLSNFSDFGSVESLKDWKASEKVLKKDLESLVRGTKQGKSALEATEKIIEILGKIK